jgi:1-acyl-sn-glycerol-3-phosphate acyltransferase
MASRAAAPSPYVRVPLATFRFWTRYFRYEVEGFDVLARAEPSLIVGYHGGPWTFDLWMLAARMHDELGYFPRAVWHPIWWRSPAIGQAVTELGGLPGRPAAAEVEAIKSRGEHLVVAPGGPREGLRPFWRRSRVEFGRRRGYVRLALEHDLPIIPVVASGLDATFIGLNDGTALSRRLLGREDVPVWLGLGLGGLWPLALPFPVKIRQRIGEPIRLDPRATPDDAHAQVTTTMQAMLDALWP